jgi:hypothetical protein
LKTIRERESERETDRINSGSAVRGATFIIISETNRKVYISEDFQAVPPCPHCKGGLGTR